jgi:O-antigen ligase
MVTAEVEVFLRASERLFVIAMLLDSTGIVVAITNPPHSGPRVVSTDLHLTSVTIDATVNLCGAILVLMRWRRVLQAARKAWPLIVLIALAPLSTAWSVDPILTLRRSALLVISTVLAIYLGERYSIDKLARMLATALCLMMILSLAARIFAPSYVIDEWGAWRGLSGYKNAFGEYMAVSVILLLLVRFHQFRWLRYVFLFTAATLLVLSHSATALLSCVLVVAAMPLWRLAHLKDRLMAYPMLTVVLVTVIYLVKTNAAFLFELLGRDATLTGRTHLWSLVYTAIAKHPILGYGYGAFWGALKGEALDLWGRNGWLAPVADNGYLDLCLGLGLLGACLFACFLLRYFFVGINYMKVEPEPVGLWPVSFLCFFALHNLGESTLLTTGTFPTLVLAVTVTSLAVSHRSATTAAHSTESGPLAREWTLHARYAQGQLPSGEWS